MRTNEFIQYEEARKQAIAVGDQVWVSILNQRGTVTYIAKRDGKEDVLEIELPDGDALFTLASDVLRVP